MTRPDDAASTDVERLARRLAERLVRVAGVVGVVLGGSHARGTHDESSDVDVGILYREATGLDMAALRGLARELDPEGAGSVTDPGEWGPWIVGGAWLTVEGRRVDWLYRPLERVADVIADCRIGRFSSHHQPGHPHGFHSFAWFGEVAVGRILAAADGTVADLQDRTRPYPPALRDAIVERFGWDAGFTLETATKAAARGDVAYVSACLSRVALDLAVIVFAANERPYTNEKGAVAEAARLPIAPLRFGDRVGDALSVHPERASLARALAQLGELRAEVLALAGR